MNIHQLRKSIKDRWLSYYIENRLWITRLQIWVNCDGQRRPSSSFILAALSILEPDLNQLLPLISDLSSNPDRVIAALGLNFNPDDHPLVLARLEADSAQDQSDVDEIESGSVKMLPAAGSEMNLPVKPQPKVLSRLDESCVGERDDRKRSEPMFDRQKKPKLGH